jgi:2-polyprenyl-6-methoxyphenol hydroxylase-like FAD-dependent oxidoreductase
MGMKQPRIAIVGAGPAGLTAALAAQKLGLNVTVFEKTLDFERVGGGLLLHSNGLRVLEALGLLELLWPVLRTCSTLTVELPDGSRLSTFDYRTLAIPHNYSAVIMRYHLQEYLMSAVEWAGVPVLMGHRCVDVQYHHGTACLRFANGYEYECDVVIACDGIHSLVRDAVGLRTEKRPIGQAYLRGIADLRIEDSTIREIWGPDGRRFGICPLPGDQTYFFCSVPVGGWRKILKSQLEFWLESWHMFGPDVVDVVSVVGDWSQVNYSEVHEVVLRRWWKLPVFVVGDAAHAMTPFMGQGANSAMVDALVLMRLLAPVLQTGGNLNRVGRAYQALRRPFVTRIQTTSRRLGSVGSWSSAPARSARNTLMLLASMVGGATRRPLLLGAGYNRREERYLCLGQCCNGART